jgi:hypothetical protein
VKWSMYEEQGLVKQIKGCLDEVWLFRNVKMLKKDID